MEPKDDDNRVAFDPNKIESYERLFEMAALADILSQKFEGELHTLIKNYRDNIIQTIAFECQRRFDADEAVMAERFKRSGDHLKGLGDFLSESLDEQDQIGIDDMYQEILDLPKEPMMATIVSQLNMLDEEAELTREMLPRKREAESLADKTFAAITTGLSLDALKQAIFRKENDED